MPAPSTTGGALMGYPTTVDTGQVAPLIIGSDTMAAVSVSGVMNAANEVDLFEFELSAQVTISGMRIRVTATATGTTDLGIYDVNGNLLTHTGAVANVASTTMTNNFAAAITLGPGVYYLAFCPSNNTDTYQRLAALTNVSTTSHYRRATTTGTAGVLPATTGAILAAVNAPMLSAVVVGGLP